MQFYFSARVTFRCAVLITGMLIMSYWQWCRHQQKLIIIDNFNKRLEEPPLEFESLGADWDGLIHRRAIISGTYDFDHEMILRNRRYKSSPGVLVLTPLHLDSGKGTVVVNRGFIPLNRSVGEARSAFRSDQHARFIGLIKANEVPKMLAPQDPEVIKGGPWIDAWLRVDLVKIQKQLPYPILPVYLEVMEDESLEKTKERIVHTDAGQDELLTLAGREAIHPQDLSNEKFPIPMYDTIVPAGRHLGYVYQWALMALITFLAGVILQLRPPRAEHNSQKTD
jgi:cytochrome oxidase assembly protein ShyY1